MDQLARYPCGFSRTMPGLPICKRSTTTRSRAYRPMTNRPVAILPAIERSDIPIPREFLTERIALIADPAELHVTLAVFRLASESGSMPPAVSEDDVLRDGVLARTFHEERKSSKLTQRIRR